MSHLNHSPNSRFEDSRIFDQKGFVVEINHDVIRIYSPYSGMSYTPHSNHTTYLRLGSAVRYSARRGTVGKKREWISRLNEYLGETHEIVPWLMKNPKLQLRIYAVVNRVDRKTSNLWLWNDTVGRIRVPPVYFNASLQPFDVVNLIAMYDGEHEDVPWTGIGLSPPMKINHEMRRMRAQLTTRLHTSDGWEVTSFVQKHDNTVGFYTFVSRHDGNRTMNAFAAWTDFTKGEIPPMMGTKCRVTWFEQSRYGKHILRAVHITPIAWKYELYHHPLNMQCLSLTSYSSRSPEIHANRMRFNSSRTHSSISTTPSPSEYAVSGQYVYHSGCISTESTWSPPISPSFEFIPLFMDKTFDPWRPTVAEINHFRFN